MRRSGADMALLRIRCDDCGDRVFNGPLTLSRCLDTGQWAYSFFCDWCGKRTVKHCNDRIASLVLELQPVLQTWTLPVVESGSGPAVTWDECFDAAAFVHSSAFDAEVALLMEEA